MQRLLGGIPNVIGAVWLVSVDGRWTAMQSHGEVEVSWVLSQLGRVEHLELVTTHDGVVNVVVADHRRALLLRLPRDSNVNDALTHARVAVRTEVS